MAIYAAKQTPDFKMVLVLPDGDESRVPAGYTVEPAMSQDLVMVPLCNIGYWGWSWRRLFESLPDDVQHSLCFAPRNGKARLDFWLDKLSAIQNPGLRVEIESVLRASLDKGGTVQ